jgi:glycosyltransferase involved in cell wall biosynthesis
MLVAHSNGLETHYAAVVRKHIGYRGLDGAPLKWYQRVLRPPVQWAYTKVDRLVTVSHLDRDYAVGERHQPPEQILALENPLPDEFLGMPMVPRRGKTVGFCGSWLANKGIETMRTDMTRILREFADCRLSLIGVGVAFRKEAWFPSDVLDQIDVTAFVEGKSELRRLYCEIAILIVPSIFEGFGLVTAEGMACGCAVVATRTGFAANLESGREILLMDEPRSPFLYERVKSLLLDDALRVAMANSGRARVQSLRWDDAVKKLSSTYAAWLDEFRRQRLPSPHSVPKQN